MIDTSDLTNDRYYIGNLQYIPSESTVLCAVETLITKGVMGPTERKILYRTRKGAFFLVCSGIHGKEVTVLDDAAAFGFMDQNSAGIDTEAYNRIFGEPERG